MKEAQLSSFVLTGSIFFFIQLLMSTNAFAASDGYCIECHGDPDISTERNGKEISLFVEYDFFEKTIHAEEGCVSCHEEADVEEGEEHPTPMQAVQCGNCHEEIFETVGKSVHGAAQTTGHISAPQCYHCHSKHAILSPQHEESTIHPFNIPSTCGACHSAGSRGREKATTHQPDIVEKYSMSIHGKGLFEDGLIATATCTSCHNAHAILRADNPNSSVNRENINDTCNRCHVGIVKKFKLSVHSPTVTKTTEKLPVCIDCHNSHQIYQVVDKDFRQVITNQCSGCHIAESKTYLHTYHGRAGLLLGGEKSAFCSDCHGAHDVYPSSDSQSRIHANTIVTTCSKCHSKVTKNFTEYLTHADHHDKKNYPLLFYSYWGMTSLLIGCFGFFGLHTLLSIPRSTVEYFQLRRKKGDAGKPVYIERFTVFKRIIHLLVIISFLTLALTGMALKFATEPWAQAIAYFGGGFVVLGALHRFMALITFFYFFLTLVLLHAKWRKSGKSLFTFIFDPEGIVPNLNDLKEMGATIKWFFGGPRPHYGRWTYWEKFDFMAVFWGIAVIGISGLALWFPQQFSYVFSGSWLNIATIIHSDEALLASGFIFTIHFYNTHLRPQKWPLDPIIFVGKLTVDELKHERPREYARLVQSGKLDTLTTEEPPEGWLVKLSYGFGLFVVTTGCFLIIAIIITLLKYNA